jgi:hypothetical protein
MTLLACCLGFNRSVSKFLRAYTVRGEKPRLYLSQAHEEVVVMQLLDTNLLGDAETNSLR